MHDCCCVSLIGYAATCYLIYRLCSLLYNTVHPFFIATPISDLVGYSGGKWAVVTGSTDGIGKEYAKQLAKKGFNICLIARNQEKLNATKKEIEDENANLQVKTIKFDFSNSETDAYVSEIEANLQGMDIGILVNNVGLSYDFANFFAEIDTARVRDVAVVNTLPAVMMTRLVMPEMLQRRKGVVVNIGSGSGLIPMPLLAAYSAAKAFVRYFTSTLQVEYANKGVFIQNVIPFMVATKMSKIRNPSFFVPTATAYVKSAIATIGVQNHTYGCFPHAIYGMLFAIAPEFVASKLTLNMHLAVRSKALKKKAEKGE